MSEELSKKEKILKAYIKEKKVEEAVKLLSDLIVRYAKKKDFFKAEALMHKLLEVDPMALSQTFEAGEIIQEEKNRAIDQKHLELWSDLYNTMTIEERDALYFSLKKLEYDGYEFVFDQGEQNTNLYFVDRGNLSLICHVEGRDALVKTLTKGDIVGQDTCFSNTVCTTSMITHSSSTLYALSRESMEKWRETVPDLDSKLRDFCQRLDRVHDLLNQKGLDRRGHRRFKLSGRGVMQVLDSSGNPVGGTYKVRLSDISAGGLAYFQRITKRKTAQLLLGRRVNMKIHLRASSEELLNQTSTVVAVRRQLSEDYSIHIRFDETLDKKTLQEIVDLPLAGT